MKTVSGLALRLAIVSSGTLAACSGPNGASESTTTTFATTTSVPTTTSPGIELPISVQSDTEMHAAGNNGPSSSILVPSSCTLRATIVTAQGSYEGGFAPNVYNRYGDIVELYVFTAPMSGYPQGIVVGLSSAGGSPPIGGNGTWKVTASIDHSLGQAVSCVVAAQPTHDERLAP